MLYTLARLLDNNKESKIHFEIISHRFTKSAKKIILEVFPKTQLPMNEDERKFKYGQFGYGKYVYDKAKLDIMKNFFESKIPAYFPNSIIDYII